MCKTLDNYILLVNNFESKSYYYRAITVNATFTFESNSWEFYRQMCLHTYDVALMV